MDAGVAVIPGYLNYRDKRIGIGEAFELSGDIETDMAHIATLFDDAIGRWPEHASPIRLL